MVDNVDKGEAARRTFSEAVDQNLDTSTISVCLAASSKPSVEHDFQRLETTPSLANSFRRMLQEFCTEQRKDRKTAREYSIDRKPNAEFVQFVSLVEYPEVRARISKLSEPGTLPQFRSEDSFVKKLRFYAIVSQLENGNNLIGLRSISPSQKPGRSRWSVQAIWNEVFKRYELLEYDPFLFDEEIDCLIYGDFMFIANRSKFEQVFNFDQMTRDIAQRALNRLESFDIENFDEFKKVCLRDRRKQRMLAPVAHDGADLSHVNVATARRVIEINPSLSSIVITVNGNEALAFDLDSANQWHLLRFLKQTTVRTVATENPFEVDGDMNPL